MIRRIVSIPVLAIGAFFGAMGLGAVLTGDADTGPLQMGIGAMLLTVGWAISKR